MMPNMNDDIYASRELFSELPKRSSLRKSKMRAMSSAPYVMS